MTRTWMTVSVTLAGMIGGPVVRADSRLLRTLATDPSPKVRAQAVLGLASRPADPGVLAALVQALEDPAPIVRGSAARVLGSLGTDESFAPLCRAAQDADRFVAKWARWAAVQVAVRSPSIAFSVRDIRVEPGRLGGEGGRKARILADDITRNLQDGVLQGLIGTGRFDVDSGMDFSDEVEGAERVAPDNARRPGVRLALRGRLVRMSGDDRRAEVEARIEAVCPSGTVLWEGPARGVGAAEDKQAEDDYVDEYTIPREPVDARVRAAEVAGRAAANDLARALSPGSSEGR